MSDHLKVLKEKIIMQGLVEPLTPLHIGWQRSFDPVDSDSPVIKDPQGRPFIPGSSFKGILRGFIESFLSGAGVNRCFPTDDDPCIKDKEKWKDRDYVLENTCPVCRIFGSSYIGSKLKIKDMPVKEEMWHEIFLRVRDGIVIDRESRTAKDKGKYDFETVAPGVQFHMEMVGDNLSDEEKGLLFTALDLISRGFGSLGGNVSRGTGRIRIEIKQIERLDPQKFFQQFKDSGGEVAPELISGEKLEEYKMNARKAFSEKKWPEGTNV